MDNPNMDWQLPANRQKVKEQIDEVLRSSGETQRNCVDVEKTIFQKSNGNRDEYMKMASKLVHHYRSAKKKPESMADPINALQNLASQGSRQMPSQMMPMGVGGAGNANVLQNLIHQRATGQQPIQGMGNMQGARAGPGPGQQQPMPGNILMGAMNANQTGGQINQMNPMTGQMPMNIQGGQMNPNMNQTMNVNPNVNANMNANVNPNVNPNMNPNAMGMNMNQSMPQNQMNPNVNPPMNPNQMSQLMGRINAPQPNMNAAAVASHPSQMPNQMNANAPSNLPSSAQSNLPPNQQLPANINQPSGPPNQVVSGPSQMNLNQMMSHMGRTQAPNVYQVRNTTPNQPFCRKSPSPSAPSPMGPTLPIQMVPSPALVPSPQVAAMATRNVMAPSPSNTNLNTPGQTGAAPSPLNAQEEQLYRDKYRQLTKYIEPLKKIIARIGQDDERLLKMNKLLEILTNPNQRIPLETLLKCEVALERMDFKSYAMTPGGPPGSKEHNMNHALMEAVTANSQSPIGNHTLQRTFRPCLEALFGPDIKNIPPTKQPRLSAPAVKSHPTGHEIPHLLQGEIARLDYKFRVSMDPTSHPNSRTIKLMCSLDDNFLPCVPPIFVAIPEDYPTHSPNCNLLDEEYNATPFLSSVQKALWVRVSKLPKPFSLSHLLDTWEMSIRHAC